MSDIKQTLHRWNMTFQLVFLILIFGIYSYSLVLTLYNLINLFFGLDMDYVLLTLKSGLVLIGSTGAFTGCLFNTSLFDTLIDETDTKD